MIGQVGQQVLIKHGAYLIHVHPCTVILKEESRGGLSKDMNDSRVMNQPEEETGQDDVGLDNSVDVDDDDDDRRVNNTTNNETVSERENEGKWRLEKGALVKVGLQNQDWWNEVKLISRARKVSCKYKNCWNVENCATGDKYHVDFDSQLVT